MIRLTNADQVAGALKFMRETGGLSQRKLASLTGFQQAQIGGWELQDRCPNVSSLLRLADALGYDLALIPREATDGD
jgi:transcriptional regulator with XRE-family HTH domain